MTVDTLTREDTGIFAALSADVERIYRPLDKHLTHYRRELDALFAADLDELIRDVGPETMEWPPFPDAADTPEDDEPDPVQAQLAARFGPAPDETMPGRAVVPGDGIPVLAAAYRGERPFVPDPADYPQPGRYRGPRSRLWRRVDGWLRDKDTRLRARLNERFTPVKEED